MKLALLLFFFLTAILYASVGFGGGSTYTALLGISGVSYLLIPIISLSCNIIVVSGNSLQYFRSGYLSIKRVWPFLVLSVPMAWVGGLLHISEIYFFALLAISLLFAGISLLQKREQNDPVQKNAPFPITASIGAGLGLLSGIVGIGGGIFLAPILYKISWGSAKHIAALCSVFILVNSAFGLLGQMMKHGSFQAIQDTQSYWLLLPIVMLGGYIGNRLNLQILSELALRRLTAFLILSVAVRLLWKVYTLVSI